MSMQIKNIAIVGGGTAGWITAALLSRMLGRSLSISVIESDQIASVGVGEASIPPMLTLTQALGLDEKDFIRSTNATIKLGIEFAGWGAPNDVYMHAFGGVGQGFPFCGFEQFWLRGLTTNDSSDFWDYSLNYQAAKAGRFDKINQLPNTNMGGLVYAYHFDASLFAQYLRKYSERAGVKRIEGMVDKVNCCVESGDIESLGLRNGDNITADLFIDCSGFRGLLIEKALKVPYQDWSHFLPCDRAVTVQSTHEVSDDFRLKPYTQSIAHSAGWRWKIPLQDRIGNGLVFSSQHMDDAVAQDTLMAGIEGEIKGVPRFIDFQTGRREYAWSRNCIAIGLSSGFLEPLESTSIHMIQSAVTRLIKMFPHYGIKSAERDEFNRQTRREAEHVRDFILLHYKLNSRSEEFWRACRENPIPDSLNDKIELFRQSGKIFNDIDALFSDVAWQQVMIGQGLLPQDYHPLANSMSAEQLPKFHHNIKAAIQQAVQNMPGHAEFLKAANRS